MSEGLKIGIGVAALAVVGYLVLNRSSAAQLTAASSPGNPLAPTPGVPTTSPSTLTTVNNAVQSGASSITRTALVTGGQTALAIATGGVSLLATTSTGRSIVKGVAGGVATAGKAVGSAAVSVYHDIASVL